MTESSSPAPAPAAALDAARRALAEIIERYCSVDGAIATAVPGLSLFRAASTSTPICAIYKSVLAVAVQGRKRLVLGDENFEYDSRHYLITSVDLPVMGQIIEASPERPYLCAIFDMDAHKIADLSAAIPLVTPATGSAQLGLGVSALTVPVMDALLRLARLLDTPRDIPVLAPLHERELLYRLLTGDQGPRLRAIAAADSQSHRTARAVAWIKENFDQPLSIDALAEAANMSKSSLHHHFKSLTAMSPLQYQKQIRLQEARKLMLLESMDAASVARRVGYESPSQFSREYRRLFGAPPMRDVARIR